MPFYRQYQKLQKCYPDGRPAVPPEYKKGTLVRTVEKDDIASCEANVQTQNTTTTDE